MKNGSYRNMYSTVTNVLFHVIFFIGDNTGGGGEPLKPKAWSNFDPSGLERAAKAARDLDGSSIILSFIDLYILFALCEYIVYHPVPCIYAVG